jgi:hypothetical protein
MSDDKLQIANRKLQMIAWHGWRMQLPESWNPVKVEGDWEQGSLLIADMLSAKLGLRWRRMKRGDPVKVANQALRKEVGSLAADEAVDQAMGDDGLEGDAWRTSRVYVEPKPPGRDVWIGWSSRSGRVLEIVHHAKVRDRMLVEEILPSLRDTPLDAEQAWSIFDLSCRTPAGWTLQWYRLNAGDLSLSFRKKKSTMLIRQIAPAQLALARQSMDGWLSQLPKALKKLYRPLRNLEDATLEIDGRTLEGRRGAFLRRRRLWWAWMIQPRQHILGFHDAVRNRLVIAQGDDEPALRAVLATSGWAKTTR